MATGIFFTSEGGVTVNAQKIFSQAFVIEPLVLIPAILIVVLSLLRLKVQLMMGTSILASAAVAFWIQGISLDDVLKISALGYAPTDKIISKLLSGGGIISMANVIAIVCLSSFYAGIFQATGFLNRLQSTMINLGKKFSSFVSVLVAAIITNMIGCNQTLAIMLTHQLCKKVEPNAEKFALHIENTAVIIAPLVPWSIANVVPLTLINAPESSIFAAWYLWLIIICCLLSKR